MLFSCNSIPKNYGDRSDGFYRRLIIIRFNHAVPQEKKDPNLLDKFRVEADSIFLLVLEGLRRLMANRYVFSETDINREELQQYREESDSVLSFVKEDCELGDGYEVSSTQFYNAYSEECGLKPFSQKQFVSQIVAANDGVTRRVDKVGKKRTLAGIELTDENTGTVETIRGTNMVTNAVNHLLGLNPMGVFYKTSGQYDEMLAWNDELLPIRPHMIGGIFISERRCSSTRSF